MESALIRAYPIWMNEKLIELETNNYALDLAIAISAQVGEIAFIDAAGDSYFSALRHFISEYRHDSFDDYIFNPSADIISPHLLEVGLIKPELVGPLVAAFIERNVLCPQLAKANSALLSTISSSLDSRPDHLQFGYESSRIPPAGFA
ncbi:MAG: hypothetical protein EOP06_29110, partial [Proteobacteria bacterium]